ncbi:S8 family peptidase [Paenibacillus taichungensis]|uniref:S8 family peptidase n=1 Tax=Paenibacillus taichungensis TaxID=484184 RepID=UPI0038D1C74F
MSDDKYRFIRFNQREQDNLRTEGGGKDTIYPWTLKGEDLKKRSEFLIEQLNNIEKITKPSIKNFPYILTVSIINDAKAKSHQNKLITMFNVDNSFSQLGMLNENKLILKLDQEESIKKTSVNLSQLTKNQNSISAITEIKLFEPNLTVDEQEDVYKVNFIDFHDDKLNKDVLNYVEEKLKSENISFERQEYSRDHNVLEVTGVTLDKLSFIKELPVKNIEPMPSVESPFLDDTKYDLTKIPFVKFDSSKVYPVVGLLDDGVTILPQLEGFVRRGNGCNYNDSEINTYHGTFIAHLLVHGNNMNCVNDYSIDGCTIIDVPVVPNRRLSEPELIKNIEDAVSSNPEVKIWNLSVSLVGELSDDNKFSDYAIELDRIQDEYNVLICKSAGNDANSYIIGNEPKRISIGADSVRSLTVGSISRIDDDFGFSKENHPAPYSRIGRGPAAIIKPDVVHYGGDIFSLSVAPTSVVDFEKKGERSIMPDGSERIEPGTSFSTPKIAKLLAELYLALGMSVETFDPLLLKTLVIHSANYLENVTIDGLERLKRVGFGKPRNSREIVVQESPHSVTLLLKGNLRKKSRIDIMDFPFPKNLIKDNYFTGEIKVTLVYNNHLSKEMGPEYCQSDIVLRMGTYDKLIDRDTTINTILNPIGRSDSKNILLKDVYGKRKITQNTDFLKERNLIEYGDKYYPVKKFSANLDEAKDSVQRNHLTKDRKWFLFLEGQYRDFIYQRLDQDDRLLSMDFVLAVTITDPTNTKDVYNETIRELNDHNFEFEIVDVNESVEIDSLVISTNEVIVSPF